MTARLKRRQIVNAIIYASDDGYVGECVEVTVVTQGRTLAKTINNLQEAVSLHFEGEDLAALEFSERPRLRVHFDVPLNLPTRESSVE